MVINEERYEMLWNSLDKYGIDEETLFEIDNIAKRISVVRFKKGDLSITEFNNLFIRLVMEDNGLFFSIHTMIGPGVKDGEMDADMIYSLWRGKEHVEDGFWWMDDFIERFRDREPLMVFNRVVPRRDRENLIKDAYYENIYSLNLDSGHIGALKTVCQKVLERLTFKKVGIEYNNEGFRTFFMLNNSVRLDIFFSCGKNEYKYVFSKEGKNIEEGMTEKLDEIIELWYQSIETKTVRFPVK